MHFNNVVKMYVQIKKRERGQFHQFYTECDKPSKQKYDKTKLRNPIPIACQLSVQWMRFSWESQHLQKSTII